LFQRGEEIAKLKAAAVLHQQEQEQQIQAQHQVSVVDVLSTIYLHNLCISVHCVASCHVDRLSSWLVTCVFHSRVQRVLSGSHDVELKRLSTELSISHAEKVKLQPII